MPRDEHARKTPQREPPDPPKRLECHSPCAGYGVYVSEYGVYACGSCGAIASYEKDDPDGGDGFTVTTRGKPLLTGGEESEYVRIIGRVVLDEIVAGPLAVVKSPYEAKEAIKELPFRQSERRWSDEVNHWVIHDSWRGKFVNHMRDQGWKTIDLVALRENDTDG